MHLPLINHVSTKGEFYGFLFRIWIEYEFRANEKRCPSSIYHTRAKLVGWRYFINNGYAGIERDLNPKFMGVFGNWKILTGVL